MTRAPLQTDRRAALRSLATAALCVPVLAACDATDTTAGRSSTERPTTGAADTDSALVAALAPRIAALRVAATTVAKHSPAYRAWALDLASMHQQHLRRLGAATARAASPPPRTPAALVSAERSLQDAMVRSADGAESGALAQVLASMAAAIEQRLVHA